MRVQTKTKIDLTQNGVSQKRTTGRATGRTSTYDDTGNKVMNSALPLRPNCPRLGLSLKYRFTQRLPSCSRRRKSVTVVAQECGSLQYPKGVVHTRLGWHRIIGHADKSARPLRERRQNGESGSPYTTAQERLTRRLVGRHETSVITERFEQSAPMSLCFSIFQRYGTRRQSCRVHLLQDSNPSGAPTLPVFADGLAPRPSSRDPLPV